MNQEKTMDSVDGSRSARVNPVQKLWLMLLCLGIIGCSGCTGKRSYKRGIYALEQGRYEQAVAYLEQSIDETKRKGITQSARQLAWDRMLRGTTTGHKKTDQKVEQLTAALTKAGNWNYQDARRAYERTDLAETQRRLQRALSYVPHLTDATDLLEELTAKSQRAQALRRSALKQAEQDQWDKALELLDEALALDKSMSQGRADRKKILQGGHDWYCELATKALLADNRSGVRDYVNKARHFVPESSRTKDLIGTINRRDEADDLVADGKQDFEAKRFEKALVKFEKAQALFPTMPGLSIQILSAKKRLCGSLIDRALAAAKKKEFYHALRLLNRSRSILAGHGGVDGHILSTKATITEIHLGLAQRYSEQRLAGNAVLHSVIALNYDRDNAAAQSLLRANRLSIEATLRYTIGFSGFRATDEHRAVADRIEASTLTYLSQAKPANVQVMDRMDLHDVLSEQDLSLHDLIDGDFSGARGKLKGVHAILSGRVLESHVLQTSQSEAAVTEYQAGVLMTPNEDYVRVVNDLNKVTRDLERTHRDLNEAESAHALAAAAYEQNPTDAHREAHEREDRHLKKARRRVETLQATQQHLQQDVITLPREIALPDMREHHYSVFTKTATAQVICFLKMVDTETSEILFTDEFKGSASESDTYIPADSTHNVVGDPLDLPHDAVMVERALADLQEGLNRSLELALRRHGHRFVLLMRKAAKAGDAVAALEQGMMYLFAYPGGYHNTGMMVRAVQEAVSEQGGLINIQVQLSRHCQIMLHHAALPATLTHEKGRLLIRRFTGGSRFNLSLPCELVAIEGKPVKSLAEVEAVLASYGPGEAVRVTVFSKGRTSRLDVSLVEK
ncbi:MAG: hypothetical protein IIC50_24190 [Planctomycetes bacterium]|nr:hypothetical protein [Planctomycetota bacterium]